MGYLQIQSALLTVQYTLTQLKAVKHEHLPFSHIDIQSSINRGWLQRDEKQNQSNMLLKILLLSNILINSKEKYT